MTFEELFYLEAKGRKYVSKIELPKYLYLQMLADWDYAEKQLDLLFKTDQLKDESAELISEEYWNEIKGSPMMIWGMKINSKKLESFGNDLYFQSTVTIDPEDPEDELNPRVPYATINNKPLKKILESCEIFYIHGSTKGKSLFDKILKMNNLSIKDLSFKIENLPTKK